MGWVGSVSIEWFKQTLDVHQWPTVCRVGDLHLAGGRLLRAESPRPPQCPGTAGGPWSGSALHAASIDWMGQHWSCPLNITSRRLIAAGPHGSWQTWKARSVLAFSLNRGPWYILGCSIIAADVSKAVPKTRRANQTAAVVRRGAIWAVTKGRNTLHSPSITKGPRRYPLTTSRRWFLTGLVHT